MLRALFVLIRGKMKKSVIILSVILALIFIFGIVGWLLLSSTPTKAPIALIYSEGELIRTADLSTDALFIVENDGGYNKIEVKNGAISVTAASCPDGVCIATGEISHGAVPIICLPNKLEIIVKSADDSLDVVIS